MKCKKKSRVKCPIIDRLISLTYYKNIVMKFTKRDRDSFVQLLIAFAQVTFGVFWASLFLPVDQYLSIVIVLNVTATIAFIYTIWWLNRK